MMGRVIGSLVLSLTLAGCALVSENSGPGSAPPIDILALPEMEVLLSANDLDHRKLGTAIFHATNKVRRELGLRPFNALDALDKAADLQASSNALNQAALHSNIVPAWATPADRVRKFGLKPSLVSENAALLPLFNLNPDHGYVERTLADGTQLVDGQTGLIVQPHTYASFARRLVDAWMNSPPHRANIVNPNFRFLGCSARPTKSVTGMDLITSIQVFFTPIGR
jgi:uncharacterized protein YkwD